MATLQWATGTNNGTEQANQRVAGTGPWTPFDTPVTTTGTSFASPVKSFTSLTNTVYEMYVQGSIGCGSGIVEKINFSCPTISKTTGVSSATISIPTSLSLSSVDFILTGPVTTTNNEPVTSTTTSTTFVGLTPGNYTVAIIMYSSAGSSSSLTCNTTFTIATPACTGPTNLVVG